MQQHYELGKFFVTTWNCTFKNITSLKLDQLSAIIFYFLPLPVVLQSYPQLSSPVQQIFSRHLPISHIQKFSGVFLDFASPARPGSPPTSESFEFSQFSIVVRLSFLLHALRRSHWTLMQYICSLRQLFQFKMPSNTPNVLSHRSVNQPQDSFLKRGQHFFHFRC